MSAAASGSTTAPVVGTEPPKAAAPPTEPAPDDVATPPSDAQRTPSGLVMKVLAPGTGTDHPAPTDYAEVDFSGWTRDGKLFDGSHGKPRRYDLSDVIDGWREALVAMVPGEKRRIWVPKELAYANRPRTIGPPKTDLTYDLELVRIVPSPVTPPDVSAPPKDVKATASGLHYRVLTPGTGKQHPRKTSRVEVSYAAWTAQGKLFETSLLVGDAMPVRLERLISGWSEGLTLMVEGERMRLWIPGKLAYGEIVEGREVPPFMKPPGPVVFDVELVKILGL